MIIEFKGSFTRNNNQEHESDSEFHSYSLRKNVKYRNC